MGCFQFDCTKMNFMSKLIPAIHQSLDELIVLLKQLPDAVYAEPCADLSHATIGEHTRHIIEMFLCLLQQYESGNLNYDLRERNCKIQTDTEFAIGSIKYVKSKLEKPNKTIALKQIINGTEILIESNYERELLYNLEHCIHHQALIKVAVRKCKNITIDENFGVARSTIEYRNQCAQ